MAKQEAYDRLNVPVDPSILRRLKEVLPWGSRAPILAATILMLVQYLERFGSSAATLILDGDAKIIGIVKEEE